MCGEESSNSVCPPFTPSKKERHFLSIFVGDCLTGKPRQKKERFSHLSLFRGKDNVFTTFFFVEGRWKKGTGRHACNNISRNKRKKRKLNGFPNSPFILFPSPQKKRSNEEAAHKSLSYFIACDWNMGNRKEEEEKIGNNIGAAALYVSWNDKQTFFLASLVARFVLGGKQITHSL